MKTPAQWMEELTEHGKYDAIVSGSIVAEIQQDSQPKYGRYTEATLTTPGWYFWYPSDPHSTAGFVFMAFGLLTYPNFRGIPYYSGTYLGPVEPPKL